MCEPTIIIETERVWLREFTERDAAAVLAFNGDPRVMQHTGEPLWSDLQEARRRLREYPDYRRHGYGRWAIVHKADRTVIGFNGLKYLEELGETDLGYRLAFRYWGRGLATESSLAVLQHGFERLELRRIVALVVPGHAASIRVLQKIGMRRIDRLTYLGVEAERWALTAEEWRQRSGATSR